MNSEDKLKKHTIILKKLLIEVNKPNKVLKTQKTIEKTVWEILIQK